MNDFPEFSTDELVRWLQAKYRRHGEIEDGVAAERLKSLSAELGHAKAFGKATHESLQLARKDLERESAEVTRQKCINATHLEEHQRLVKEVNRLQELAWKYKMERVSTEQTCTQNGNKDARQDFNEPCPYCEKGRV